MKKFSTKCSCGYVLTVDAATKEEAATKMQQMMDQKALDAHWVEHHKNDTMPKPTVEQAHAMLAQGVYEDTSNPVAM